MMFNQRTTHLILVIGTIISSLALLAIGLLTLVYFQNLVLLFTLENAGKALVLLMMALPAVFIGTQLFAWKSYRKRAYKNLILVVFVPVLYTGVLLFVGDKLSAWTA